MKCGKGDEEIVRVLAIEDNPGDLRLVLEFLQAPIFGQCTIGSTGLLSKALEMLEAEEYDVILLDLHLPDSDGFETFTKIHGKFPQVPIVVLTGSTDEEKAVQAINEGAQDYLFKNDMTSRSLSRSIIFSIERKLIEGELMAEKSRSDLYLDLLTHDINNYITAALGYLQLAEMRLHLEEKDKKLIFVPIRELRKSSELIANVRSIQRLDRFQTELEEVKAMLEQIKEEYEHPLGREVTITMEAHDAGSFMTSSLLKDAFGNIVSNAIKHSTGPVAISIDLAKVTQDGHESCQVSIEDNGPGIPDEMKEKVFDRMTRGDTKATGNGLGLYLVKRLVEEHEGTVRAEDRVPGDHTKGVRFVVIL